MTQTRCYIDQELPSDLGILSSLYPILHRWAEEGGLERHDRSRVSVAVTEAVTNAIIHAHADRPHQRVYVRLAHDNGMLTAEIGDRGEWPWQAPAPPGPDRWEQPGGRGLVLMDRLAAELTIGPRPGGGTRVWMAFRPDEKTKRSDTSTRPDAAGEGGKDMEYREECINDVDVMRISGRIDLVTSNTLKDAIRERLHRQRLALVLNLERVDFINSSGLGALVSMLKDVRLVNGRMALCDLAPYVQEIFEITQLSNVFEIFPGEKEAVASLATHVAAATGA